jgi:hypothetical protein
VRQDSLRDVTGDRHDRPVARLGLGQLCDRVVPLSAGRDPVRAKSGAKLDHVRSWKHLFTTFNGTGVTP